jgi:hypothetical protein
MALATQPRHRGQLGLQLQRHCPAGERGRCQGHLQCNAPASFRLTVPRKYFRKYLPDPEKLRSSRMVAAFGRWLHHPNLWHLNRRSVSGAVAIGLFSGLVRLHLLRQQPQRVSHALSSRTFPSYKTGANGAA